MSNDGEPALSDATAQALLLSSAAAAESALQQLRDDADRLHSQPLNLSFFRRCSKMLPDAPFGKRTTGLGAREAARSTAVAATSSGLRVLGVYVAKAFAEHHCHPVVVAPSSPSSSGSGKRRRPDEEVNDASSDFPSAAAGGATDAISRSGEPNPITAAPDEARDRSVRLAEQRVYVRVLVDKSLEVSLPLEVMRRRHPQVLIDYLLSTAVFC